MNAYLLEGGGPSGRVVVQETSGVFHTAEQSLHNKLDIGERQHELGLRMIRDHMPDQHRDFFSDLSSVHIGAVDPDGHPWAIMRTGAPEFMTSPDDKTLNIASHAFAGEPDDLNLTMGAKVSVVGIAFETQRRNHLNATITSFDGNRLSLHVDQSYGNCLKYTQI
jgi:predicted pyridoxine 5'-phosphate oxidase superfamily flavin-nucleotide-binding protein